MTNSKKTYGWISLVALTGLAFVSVLVLSPRPNRTAVAALPERPPTFQELMLLADNGLAQNSLIQSYIYNQPNGMGAQRVFAEAAKGDDEAELMSCYLLIAGIGIEEDEDRGYEICETSAKKGFSAAKANLIYRDLRANPDNMDWKGAHKKFQALIKTDPARAHRGLQSLYGLDHPKASPQLMRYHLQQAIKHGNTNAMHGLAEFDFRGRPRYRNVPRGKRNLEKAYSLNDFDAGYTLAIEYKTGRYFEKDLERYAEMIQRMSAFLHPASLGELGYMYKAGLGVEKDDGKASDLFARAAELGNPYAQKMAGFSLLSDPTSLQDRQSGIKYLEIHARSGDVHAMVGLARHYETEGVANPNNEKAHWRARAAMHGDQHSQDILGYGYMDTGYIKEVAPYIAALEIPAKAGDPYASFLLARHYRAASGVDRDIRKAQLILKKVAHAEHPRVIEEMDVIEGYITYFGSIDASPAIIKHGASSGQALP